MQILSQAKIAHTIDNAKIYRLGLAPQFAVHILYSHSENLSSSTGMNILIVTESSQEIFILRHIRQHPKLNLAVISRYQQIIALTWLKHFANMAPFLPTDRNIL